MPAIATKSLQRTPPVPLRRFRHRLLGWFDGNLRDLPWRRDRDPYRVWVSEIMLQQTRVAVVRDRYLEFLRRFPGVEQLAAAKVADVLAAWSGLGYYRRARALHAGARAVVKGGRRFPQTPDELMLLPGVGRYTAAAIASIAFNQPCAAVDGNVERVLGRLFNFPKRDAWRVAAELLSRSRPGDFNQAMMELGATVCLPKSPLCDECPVFAWCRTRGAGASRVSSSRRRKSVAYRLAVRNQSVFLVQRDSRKSLMPGMWELPQIPPRAGEPTLRLRHAITNTDYDVSVYLARSANGAQGRWVSLAEIKRLPLTGLTQKILRRLRFI